MNTKPFIFVGLAVVFLALAALGAPSGVVAAQVATPFPTPTPGDDGRILYTVLPGDSPLVIAIKFGLDYEQLRILNNWSESQELQEGDIVLLGIASEQQPTAQPTAAPEETPEESSEGPGTGMLCILLFEDVNGDGLRQETEFGIEAGQISVSERTGLASQTSDSLSQVDVDGEPIRTCFQELPTGEYTISVAAPEGYNPTTAQNTTVNLGAGDETSLNFGAQLNSENEAGGLFSLEDGRSPLFGLLGMVMLLSGAGLGYYTWRGTRRR